jgi:hypothetical protein
MKLTVIRENEDGSADVQLDNIEPRMLQLLIQEGFIAILSRQLDALEKEKRIPALFKRNTDEL